MISVEKPAESKSGTYCLGCNQKDQPAGDVRIGSKHSASTVQLCQACLLQLAHEIRDYVNRMLR